MRLSYLVTALITISSAHVYGAPLPDVTISAQPDADGFSISGGFVVPLNLCQAYNYLTDYEIEREMPGVISVSHVRLSARRVQLHRELQERVLFLPIQIQSVVEITEQPQRGMDFVQISGSARSYKGQWRLESVAEGTRFIYRAQTDPGTIFPDSMARQVIEDSLRRNFDAMVVLAQRRQGLLQSKCVSST